jgi:hypothetical protein
MMVEKESGRLERQEFPSLWEAKALSHGLKRSILFETYSTLSLMLTLVYLRYWNTVTGTSQAHPPSLCLGGLLADVRTTLQTVHEKSDSSRTWAWGRP